jgi:hypothetical protein
MKRITRWIGVDRAIAFTLLARSWSAGTYVLLRKGLEWHGALIFVQGEAA